MAAPRAVAVEVGAKTGCLYSIAMPRLFLNRRQNYGNRLLTERPGDEVGYLLPDGD